MKLATPFVTVAAALFFAASHQAQAAQSSALQEAALVAADSPAVLVAQANMMSPRGDRAGEPSFGSPAKRGAHVAAQKGPEALRRYIDRTRMIYALDYQEFAKP